MKQSKVARRSLACAGVLVSAGALAACGDGYGSPLPPRPVQAAPLAPPPAISGGTLLVTDDGLAVAADPDRDLVTVVDLASSQVRGQLALEAGDEPGRVVADDRGHFHVALRRGGAIVDFDADAKELGRRDACAAPRGMAFDAAAEVLYLACAGGELMTFPVDGGEATRSVRVLPDLRDVVVDGDKLVVSQFRSAKVLTLDAEGAIARARSAPSFVPMSGQGSFTATVGYRMIGLPGGGVALSHQRSLDTTIGLVNAGGYSGAGCDPSIVQNTVTVMHDVASNEAPTPLAAVPSLPGMSLPVDVAVTRSGGHLAIVAAGTDLIIEMPTDQGDEERGRDCGSTVPEKAPGQPIAVAYTAENQLVVQLRNPPALWVEDKTIQLAEGTTVEPGHDFFHRPAQQFTNEGGDLVMEDGMGSTFSFSSSLACASCHPEGREDGHTWLFDIGPRRTQNIGGGVLESGPLHWDGDLGDFDAIMNEVFVRRMSGMRPAEHIVEAAARFVEALPQLPTSPAVDVEAAERGRALFESEAVGCTKCHAGERLSNEQNFDVGTGKPFQVPSLVGVSQRLPLMHDGCATSLEKRFSSTACGGGDKHGVTSQLDEAQVADLVAYLETL